jgi:hypothetical protein
VLVAYRFNATHALASTSRMAAPVEIAISVPSYMQYDHPHAWSGQSIGEARYVGGRDPQPTLLG